MNSNEPLATECVDGVVATKVCTKCLESKLVTAFHWKGGKRGLARHPWCKECASAINRQRYRAAPEKAKARASARYAIIRADPERYHTYSLRLSASQLGLDPDVVASRFEGHDGLCDICGEPNVAAHPRLLIDHDHETGELRGLLCHNCNTAIGLLRDSSAQVMAAAAYLESHMAGER